MAAEQSLRASNGVQSTTDWSDEKPLRVCMNPKRNASRPLNQIKSRQQQQHGSGTHCSFAYSTELLSVAKMPCSVLPACQWCEDQAHFVCTGAQMKDWHTECITYSYTGPCTAQRTCKWICKILSTAVLLDSTSGLTASRGICRIGQPWGHVYKWTTHINLGQILKGNWRQRHS